MSVNKIRQKGRLGTPTTLPQTPSLPTLQRIKAVPFLRTADHCINYPSCQDVATIPSALPNNSRKSKVSEFILTHGETEAWDSSKVTYPRQSGRGRDSTRT